ncbi:MAG: DUF58 domain-containing protein [Methanocorpusculum sp.]|nr:DUF58 domain-containing protein [Methanocorpusculum sp.]
MRPTPLTGVLILFAFISVVCAWLLNDAKAAAAAFGILAVIIIRAVIFQNRLKSFISETTVSRKTDVEILKQGGVVSVSIKAEYPAAEFTYSCEDIYPAGALLVSGSTILENGSAEYKLKMPLMGKSNFGGVMFTCEDLFIKSTVLVKNADKPDLTVFPTGIAATISKSAGTGVWAEEESERIAIIPGSETRTFREFQSGDSTRDIDWKMSAKHDELYIRERTDASGDFPMVIIDLPPAGTDVEVTADFLNAADGVIEEIRKHEAVPIVFFCGSDFIGITYSENLREVNSYLETAGKIQRETALFRLKHAGVLRISADKINGDSSTAAAKIKEVMKASSARYQGEFEKRSVNLTKGMSEITAVLAVTAGIGDISHLTHITADSVSFGKEVSFVVAGTKHTKREEYLKRELTKAGSESVEVVS